LEVVTAYFIDQKGWSRKKATIQFGAVITVVGAFCSFSLGGGINITEFLGMPFMDFMDYLSSKYMLPIGGMLTAIFVLKKWRVPNFFNELKNGLKIINLSEGTVKVLFEILILFLLSISAAVVAFILFNEVYAEIFGKALIG
ncbi:MAG: sodium-dependent transporter, partial [Candidatus Marinimicrobia bacterium]|nr:sodium-dependent transporter [Candidatus Neomarinimicrobiota bacterium]